MTETSHLLFTVVGEPVAAPRMTRADKWKQRPCVLRYRAWKDLIRATAGEIPPAEQVIELSWCAVFSPPASWSKKKRAAAIGTFHRSKPDRDNLDKAVLDALYPDGDAAIAFGTIRKEWGLAERLDVLIKYRKVD